MYSMPIERCSEICACMECQLHAVRPHAEQQSQKPFPSLQVVSPSSFLRLTTLRIGRNSSRPMPDVTSVSIKYLINIPCATAWFILAGPHSRSQKCCRCNGVNARCTFVRACVSQSQRGCSPNASAVSNVHAGVVG